MKSNIRVNRTAKPWVFAFMLLAIGSMLFACDRAPGFAAAFNEDAAAEIKLGESIIIDDYIVKVDGSTYMLTAKREGAEADPVEIRGATWLPEEPGTYTLTYTVTKGKSSVSNTFSLTVKPPRLSWNYTAVIPVYEYGSDFVFADYIDAYNFSVDSYCGYTLSVTDVTVDGIKTSFMDETKFAIRSKSDHMVTIACVADDGQRLTVEGTFRVKYIDPDVRMWMEESAITAYDCVSVDADKTVVLDAGSYTGSLGSGGMASCDLPYVAFHGNYGCGTFAEFDFTGKNLPQVAFFVDEVSPSLIDGGKGLYISNGFTTLTGAVFSETDASRLTVFGPNKVEYKVIDNQGRYPATGSPDEPCAMSYNMLDTNTDYRYIVGFTNGLEGESGSVDLNILLINLDTSEEVFRTVQTLSGRFPENYFSGSIVAYGRFKKTTSFTIRLPQTAETVDDIDLKPSFRPDAPTVILENSELSVSDFIVVPAAPASYTFSYRFGDEPAVMVEGDRFSLDRSGTYTFIYTFTVDGRSKNAFWDVTTTNAGIYIDTEPGSLVFSTGDTLSFADFINMLEYRVVTAAVDKSVRVLSYEYFDGTETQTIVAEGPGLTFLYPGEYVFEIGGTYDGTDASASIAITVLPVNAETREWMNANGVSAYGYTEIRADNEFILDKGTIFGGTWDQFASTDLPYVAFDGDFGLYHYVSVDFIGNNMPYLAFFADASTEDIVNGKGIFISNGYTKADGTDLFSAYSNRVDFHGPELFKTGSINSDVYTASTAASAFGFSNLDAAKHYRYTAFFKNGASGSIVAVLTLFDLDDNEIVSEIEHTLRKNDENATFGEDYFAGKIVAYGRVGIETAFRVSALPTVRAVIRADAPSQAAVGTEIDFSDYATTVSGAAYRVRILSGDTVLATSDDGSGSFIPKEAGKITLELTVTRYGRSDTATKEIAVEAREIGTTFSQNRVAEDDAFSGHDAEAKRLKLLNNSSLYLSFDAQFESGTYICLERTQDWARVFPNVGFFVNGTEDDLYGQNMSGALFKFLAADSWLALNCGSPLIPGTEIGAKGNLLSVDGSTVLNRAVFAQSTEKHVMFIGAFTAEEDGIQKVVIDMWLYKQDADGKLSLQWRVTGSADGSAVSDTRDLSGDANTSLSPGKIVLFSGVAGSVDVTYRMPDTLENLKAHYTFA